MKTIPVVFEFTERGAQDTISALRVVLDILEPRITTADGYDAEVARQWGIVKTLLAVLTRAATDPEYQPERATIIRYCQRVREILSNHAISHEALAEAIGVKEISVTRWLANPYPEKIPSVRTVVKMDKAMQRLTAGGEDED